MQEITTKTFTDSFIYQNGSKVYEEKLLDYLMKGEQLDKSSELFDDVKYDIKRRQVRPFLYQVFLSDKVILNEYKVNIPKSFTVMTAKDIKNTKKLRIFIASFGNIYKSAQSGNYKLNNPDKFVANLLQAATEITYYAYPKSLVLNTTIIKTSTEAFAKLFTHVIDYLYKINNISGYKQKIMYMASRYFISCVLNLDTTDSYKTMCRNISGLTETEERLIDMDFLGGDESKSLLNIKFFIEYISDKFKFTKLTLEAFLDKWIWLYGVGTEFALELFPQFSAMITNAYVGCYINNQKHIETVIDDLMVKYTTTLLNICGSGDY